MGPALCDMPDAVASGMPAFTGLIRLGPPALPFCPLSGCFLRIVFRRRAVPSLSSVPGCPGSCFSCRFFRCTLQSLSSPPVPTPRLLLLFRQFPDALTVAFPASFLGTPAAAFPLFLSEPGQRLCPCPRSKPVLFQISIGFDRFFPWEYTERNGKHRMVTGGSCP